MSIVTKKCYYSNTPKIIFFDFYSSRNDLYVNIMHGEFSKLEKLQDRNIEMIMEVCDEEGRVIPNSLAAGVGSEPKSQYTSLVYYHKSNPKWGEIVKVILPVDLFEKSHLRFTFAHRPRRAEKGKVWAFSYMKLGMISHKIFKKKIVTSITKQQKL